MNTSRLAALFVVGFLMSIPALAKNQDEAAFNQMAAYHAANLLNQVATPNDLLSLPVSEKNHTLIETQIKGRDQSTFQKPLITMPTTTDIELKYTSQTIKLDFANFDKHILLVNGMTIRLESQKTFLNYKNEVAHILSMRKSASLFSLFVEPAEAAPIATSVSDWASYVNGAVTNALLESDAEHLSEVSDGSLESALIHGYRNSFKQKANPMQSDGSFTAIVPTFECKDGKLSSLIEAPVSTNGKTLTTHEVQARIEKTPDGYIFTSDMGHATLDSTFKVTSPGYVDVKKGGSMLTAYPFYHFPDLASRCCEKVGCADKVRAGFVSEIKTERRAHGVR